MKKPIEKPAPTPEALRRIKEAAWKESRPELSETRAYPALLGSAGKALVNNDIHPIFNAILDYRYKRDGSSEKTVAAAEQKFRDDHPEIPRKQMEELLGRIRKIANRYIDDGYVQQAIEREIEHKIQLVQNVRRTIFPSAPPPNHRAATKLQKIEKDYALAEDRVAIMALRGKLEGALIDFIGMAAASDGNRLEVDAGQTARAIIDAIDTALGREPRDHPRVATHAGVHNGAERN